MRGHVHTRIRRSRSGSGGQHIAEGSSCRKRARRRRTWNPSLRGFRSRDGSTYDCVIPVSGETAVIGVDGWADGRCGDFWGSTVRLNDFLLIQELTGLDDVTRLSRMRALGDAEAARLRDLLAQALALHRRVVVVTHVPPFGEAAWHDGRPSAPDWAPFFACKATGDVLLEVAAARPDVELLVLCGHTHGEGTYQPLPNLRVLTGGAAYGDPQLQEVLELP